MAQHPADVLSDDLVRLYANSITRLEGIVRAGLQRGLDPSRVGEPGQQVGDATLRYRQNQLRQARLLLGQLRSSTGHYAAVAASNAYRATLAVIDSSLGAGVAARGTFGTVHVGAVQAIANNMTATLQAAVDQAGDNVAAVFARADAIEGALQVGRSPGPIPFIGRRQDDPYRRVALEAVGEGTVALDTRRQISEQLVRKLLDEGITDALTGFVDRAGRRWPLHVYAEMVARTTTREAVTRATVNRLIEGNVPIVTVSSHPHQADECSDYDGETFALTSEAAAKSGYPQLDVYPPFHPRCLHVLTPGTDNLDNFERDLADTAATGAAPAGPVEPAPFGDHVDPHYDPETAGRLEAQRVANAIAADPGPEPGAREAFAKAANRHGLAESKAIDRALGPDIAKELGRKWAKDGRLRADLLNGRRTLDDVREEVIEHVDDEWKTRYEREARREAEAARGGGDRYRCFNCSRFVAGKYAKCQSCGYDHNGVGSHPAAEGGLGADTAARRARLRAERRRGRKRWL